MVEPPGRAGDVEALVGGAELLEHAPVRHAAGAGIEEPAARVPLRRGAQGAIEREVRRRQLEVIPASGGGVGDAAAVFLDARLKAHGRPVAGLAQELPRHNIAGRARQFKRRREVEKRARARREAQGSALRVSHLPPNILLCRGEDANM